MIGQCVWLKNNLLLENTFKHSKIDLLGTITIYNLRGILLGEVIHIENSHEVVIKEFDWNDEFIKCKTEQSSPVLLDGSFEFNLTPSPVTE